MVLLQHDPLEPLIINSFSGSALCEEDENELKQLQLLVAWVLCCFHPPIKGFHGGKLLVRQMEQRNRTLFG